MPIVAIPLRPAFARSRLFVKRIRTFLLGRIVGKQQIGRDQEKAGDPPWMVDGEHQIIPGTAP